MKLTGLIAATYTPFRPDGSVALDTVPCLVEHMIDRGVSGFYVCGSTGEGESLSIEERKAVAGAFVEATANRVPVVVQVGHNSLPSACELAAHAAEVGADAISTLPPTYFKPASLDHLVDFIAEVTASAPDLPYYYYHIPRLSGVTFDTPSLLQAAAGRIPSFAGIKFSDFFLAEMMACLDFDDGRYDILFGSDEMILGALATGATGAVGSCYGFAAPLWRRILEAYAERDLEAAQAWMSKAARLVRLLAMGPGSFHAVVRQVVWPCLGIEMGAPRLPQGPLSPAEAAGISRQLESSGFLEEIRHGEYRLP